MFIHSVAHSLILTSAKAAAEGLAWYKPGLQAVPGLFYYKTELLL